VYGNEYAVYKAIESNKRIYNNIRQEDLDQEKLFLNSIDTFNPKDILKNDLSNIEETVNSDYFLFDPETGESELL
jgi:hypothetical protein